MVTAPARRDVVRYMQSRGLSERRARTVMRMSASAFRYQPVADNNQTLREQIIELAHRHRRYGASMIYLKLRQQGLLVNHKRVERLYSEAQLQVKKRKCKKVPVGDRYPLVRPTQPNQVWSMDFVFDRSADGRMVKCLTVVDDGSHECVAIKPERAIGGQLLTRLLDKIAQERPLPQVIRTDNGKELCGRAMLSWAHSRGVVIPPFQAVAIRRIDEPNDVTSPELFLEMAL